jgi:hypothetical protein
LDSLSLDECNGDFSPLTGTPVVPSLELQSVRNVDAKLRIVTHLPLRELWRDDGFLTTARGRSLTKKDVHKFLGPGPVQFVVVDVGTAPLWIPLKDCFAFWKGEVQHHFAAEAPVILDQFPGEYCYFASLWDGTDAATPLVVLEKHH